VKIPAVTLYRPWGYAILRLGKTPENRPIRTNYRGPVIIHHGLKWQSEALETVRMICGADAERATREHGEVTGFLGVVDLIGCHPGPDPYALPPTEEERCRCPAWGYEGLWHWEIANPRPFPTAIPGRGMQGLFPAPVEVVDRARMWGLL